jgi:FlaA1/EpsC-like NDP-sugar epimerase
MISITPIFLFFSISEVFIFENFLAAKILFFGNFIAFFILALSRILAKSFLYQTSEKEKILVYTDYKKIGEAINLASNSKDFQLSGIITNDLKNKGRIINNIHIYGIEDFSNLVKKNEVKKLFIISKNNIKDIDSKLFDQIISFPIKVFKIPDMNDIISKKYAFSDLKNLSLEDFISRDVDNKIIIDEGEDSIIKDKTVLVTGAGGSIGSVLCEQVLVNKPKLLILLDSSELALFKINSRLENLHSEVKIISLLVNLADKNLTSLIFEKYNIDTVYHAAAYKHVNILEHQIITAVNNNVFGTYNLLNECHKNDISKFVMISTDKAANPSTVMGMTKKFCELAVNYYNNKSEGSSYLSVRFGNVFNSSGSVIQIFKNQIEKSRDLTLTDPKVDRFFMSINEAVKLVIRSSLMGKGGEVFVLDMGTPIKILDIAKRMIHLSGNTIKNDLNPDGDIGIKITGLKNGEKMHEILSENPMEETDNPQIMISKDNKLIKNIEKYLHELKVAIKDNDEEMIYKILDDVIKNKKA